MIHYIEQITRKLGCYRLLSKAFMLFTLFLVLYPIVLIGELGVKSQPADSLLTIWENTKNAQDERFESYRKYIKKHFGNKPDSMRILGFNLLDTAQKYQNLSYQGVACDLIGLSYQNIGNFKQTIVFYMQALRHFDLADDRKGQAMLQYRLGEVYEFMGSNQDAFQFYKKALKGYQVLNIPKGEAAVLNGIGLLYNSLNHYDSALWYFNASLAIKYKIKDSRGISNSLNNIGNVFYRIENYDSARVYYSDAYLIMEKLNDAEGMANFYNNIGNTYSRKGEFNKAIQYSRKALALSQNGGSATTQMNIALSLFGNAKGLGLYKEALEANNLYHILKDSITNKNNYEEAIRQKYLYEYDLQTKADSITHAKDLIIKDEQLQSARIHQLLMLLSILILLAAALIAYQRYYVVRKQRDIIGNQSTVLQKKANEITASINYARRIQRAILPAEQTLKQQMGNCFILYRPRDIVAGDFYWYTVRDGLHFLAVADCTGHGVPGALVSMLCSSGIRSAVKEVGLSKPGEILEYTRNFLKDQLAKSDEEVYDGMDISFLTWNMNANMLHWAGAHHSLWICKDGILNEYKGDRQPVGPAPKEKPFVTHCVDFQIGDTLYLVTDGYADQFGGVKNRKFSSRQLKSLIETISIQNMEEQKNILEEQFNLWKGDRRQIDDVCILSIQPGMYT